MIAALFLVLSTCWAAEAAIPASIEELGFAPGEYDLVSGGGRTCSSGPLHLVVNGDSASVMIGDGLTIVLAAEKEEPSPEDPCWMNFAPPVRGPGKLTVETEERCEARDGKPATSRRGMNSLEQTGKDTLLYRSRGLTATGAKPVVTECRYRRAAK